MESYRATATVALLLLQFCLLCCSDAKNGAIRSVRDSLCEGETCHVPPNNFWQLQEMIDSNKFIVLNGAEFSVDDSSDFIVIENVSNLTISGGERGSLIHCSSNSTFGFHLKNTTNVTLTQLRIRNCGVSVTNDVIVQYVSYSCSSSFRAPTPPTLENARSCLLLEDSKNTTLSRIHIENSPGFGLTVIDSPDEDSIDTGNPSLRLTDSTISRSREGCLMLHGTRSMLVESTVIANSTTGIVSHYADLTLRNVDIINCKSSYLGGGHGVVRERLTMNHSSLYMRTQGLHIKNGNVLFFGDNLHLQICRHGELIVSENSVVVFTNPKFTSPNMDIWYSRIKLDSSTMRFTENTVATVQFPGVINEPTITLPYEMVALTVSQMDMINGSSLIISNNSLSDITLVRFSTSLWRTGPDSRVSMTNNIGYFLWAFSNFSLNGHMEITNNSNPTPNSILQVVSSVAEFHGILEVRRNRGIGLGGGMSAFDSELFFNGTASFSDNTALSGGGLSLTSSVMYVSPDAVVDFTSNHAYGVGGAILISSHRQAYACIGLLSCSIQTLLKDSDDSCQIFSITFNQNRAGIAGNAVYGDRQPPACVPTHRQDTCYNCPPPDISDLYIYNGVNDSSDLSSFTSDPTRVCFCDERGIPDCYKVQESVTVHPGENFNLSLAVVGYGLGTVQGAVFSRGRASVSESGVFWRELELEYSQEIPGLECQEVEYSIASEREREQFTLAVDTQSFLVSLGEAMFIASTTTGFPYYSDSFERFSHIPVFVEVDLLPCPVGFQLVRGRCICHEVLLDHDIENCFFSNGTDHILRPVPYWIGLPNDKNSHILIHTHCPFDYCQSEDLNINAETVDVQCQYQRSGVLCGSCREGLSMTLGSSECRTCSNVYLVSITLFAVMGAALVALVALLNMTVSVGSLNGLILFANILQANKDTFLPSASAMISFLSAFIAWLNLDLGIPMCFFDGLTTYVKTWLQFVFPLYILALVGVMIIASNYSTRVTRLLGTNAVSVLATLVLLSYTKILRILITAFSFTTLTGSQDYHSVVWLADGNIKYFQTKHAILFLVALLVLLLLGVPYTVTLTAAPWIQRSKFKWVSSLYNRFKPLFDAYMGPYKDRHRYWTGMLLLARVVLIVLFSSISNTNTVAGPQLNLLFLTLSSSILLALTAAIRPYRNKLLNGLEIFHLSILFIFSSSNLYISSIGTAIGPHAYIYTVLVGICFLVFLGICAGHVWYRVRLYQNGRRRPRQRQEEEEEEEEYPRQWHRARVRPDSEEREMVTISTACEVTRSTADRETERLGYRESVLDLASFN